MKNIKYSTMVLVVLLIMAVVSGWGIVWKVIVGACAIYVLVLIAVEYWKNRK